MLFIMLLASIIRCLLYAMELFLIIRAIMSWFPGGIDNKIYDFLFYVTEPLVSFVRGIVVKFRALREFPIDLSYLFSYFLIWILLELL